MSKANTGWKLGLLCQQPSCECKGKIVEGNEKCYASENTNDKKAKQPYWRHRETFTGLDRRSY